jgi:multiple sugar transport system substrate-binding protein
VPLDTHPIVLYYNKDLLEAAGLLDENGLPKGMDSREGFTATLQALKDNGVKFPLGSVTADGNFMFRTVYSLVGQQGGELLTDGEFLAGDNGEKLANALGVLAEWTSAGLQSTYTDYPATVALFTSGEAAMMINGVWEVPTMTDLNAQGKLFNWGAVELPVIFDQPSTYADSHSFALPMNQGKEMTAEKRAAVLTAISWIEKNSLLWATAGHIPAYGPVTASPEYAAMQPNATYSSLTANMIFDPKSPLAGVAGPIFDVMSTYFVPTLNGEMDPAEAVESIKEELNAL